MEDIPRAAVSQEAVSLTGWVLAGVGAVVSALATAVAYLFNLRNTEIQKSIDELKRDLAEMTEKAEDCHKERAEIAAKCEANTVRIEYLMQQIDILKRLRGVE